MRSGILRVDRGQRGLIFFSAPRTHRQDAERAFQEGQIDALGLQSRYASALALTLHADRLRGEVVCASHPVAWVRKKGLAFCSKESVSTEVGAAEAARGRPLAPVIAPIRGSCQ